MAEKIYVVGIGPGSVDLITPMARRALENSDVVVGYDTYIDLIAPLIESRPGIEIVRAGMTEEVGRARDACRHAHQGKTVSLISSGDAGLYGMAGLVFEVIEADRNFANIEVEVIPGVTAMLSAASLLGAPLVHDSCTISLSDHLTDWNTIMERVDAAASADFVVALYNPKSSRRKRQIEEAIKLFLQHRDNNTPAGIVQSAYRPGQKVEVTTLGQVLNHEINMLTTIIIGNSNTRIIDGRLVTPRGYERKYQINSDDQAIPFGERMRGEHEPWSLNNSTGKTEDDAGPETSLRARARFYARHALNRLYKNSPEEKYTHQLKTDTQPAVGLLTGKKGAGLVKEFLVSPGVNNRIFSANQVALLADLCEGGGEIEYTTDHRLILRTRADPSQVARRCIDAGLELSGSGEQIIVKACDLCEMQKTGALSGLKKLRLALSNFADKHRIPREFRLGLNGCGMSCYGAAREDLGVIYFRGAWEIHAGAKSFGRNMIPPLFAGAFDDEDRMVSEVIALLARYAEEGGANERFSAFSQRVGLGAEINQKGYV